MIETGLFGDIETPHISRKELAATERKRKAALCYQLSAEKWKAATYEFAVTVFLPGRDGFIFEQLTTAYDAYATAHSKPLTVERRAFAGLTARLLKEGKIRALTGQYGQRNNGNASQIYGSLVKK